MAASSQEIVLDYLTGWSEPGGWRRATLEHFTEDSVYENIGMSRSVGLAEVLAFIDHFDRLSGGGWMVAETSAIAAVGGTVLTERVDHMVAGNGETFMTTRVMGAFDVRDGKIVAWRDYFDTTMLDPPYDGPGSLMVAPG